MPENITNDQIKIMIKNMESKLDENASMLKEIAKEVKSVTTTVALHDYQINGISKEVSDIKDDRKETKTDAKWVVMAVIAISSLLLHIVRSFLI
jgi:sugar-specific transcriptional regulator TrmB